MSQSEADDEPPTRTPAKQPAKQHYASNSVPEILEILWQHTYSGHGLSAREIHDSLVDKLGESTPSIRTVSNQLNALERRSFLGREIHKLAPKQNEDDANELEGATDPRPGWRMSTFFDPSEARLLADGLALSRISRDSIGDIVVKLNELVGGISLSSDYLTTTTAKDDFNGEFLRTIGLLNKAITHHRSVTFNYMNYDKKGQLRPRRSHTTGKPRKYRINPYQMVFKNGRYYLACCLHDDPTQQRMFSIDRIANLQVTEALPDTTRTDFDVITYMRERPYPVTDTPTTIIMAVKAEAFNPLFEWFDSPKITGPNSTGWYKVVVRSPETAVYWWTLQYADNPIVIQKPEKLRQRLAKTGHAFAVRYGLVKPDKDSR